MNQDEMIEQAAQNAWLSPKGKKVFKGLIKQRFPNEDSQSYLNEWARRVNTGRPEMYGDEHTNKVLKKLRRELEW